MFRAVRVLASLDLAFSGLGCAALALRRLGASWSKPRRAKSSPAEAARTSQALVIQGANDLKRARRWAYLTLYAHKVKGDPFWKAVRPNGVPDYAQIKPDIVTSRFYTTCFTGVVVPYVCTTGSAACGQ